MKPAVEFLGFTSAALLVHLAVFAATAPDGTASGGDGGRNEVSMAAPLGAANAELVAMVRKWDTPVTLAAPVVAPSQPVPADAPPALPIATLPDDSVPRLTAPLSAPPPAQDLPDVAGNVPPLFATPADRPTTRPRQRPDPQRSAPAPQQPQTAAPRAQRAAGQGSQGQRGEGRAQTQSGTANSASALAEWGGQIRTAIQRQQRSPGARARGTVQLRLQVRADGQLAGVSLAQSSGNGALDQAAVQAVQRARLPRAPSGVSGTHHFNLPLSYR